MMTAAGCVYVLWHGQSFLSFYNLVNEAVMQLDFDATSGLLAGDIRGSIVFSSLFIICLVLSATGSLHSLEEVSIFATQCVAYFFVKDIMFRTGDPDNSYDPFTATQYEDLLPACKKMCKGCYDSSADANRCKKENCYNIINSPEEPYTLAKWGGIFILVSGHAMVFNEVFTLELI